MKTKKIVTAATLLICMAFIALSFTTISSKSKVPNPPKKGKVPAKMAEIYFEIQPEGSSNIFVIIGRGSATSGTLDGYEIGCVVGKIDASGAVSGTYTYNSSTGEMSLNGTVTPSESLSFPVIGSPIEFSASPITINCGSN